MSEWSEAVGHAAGVAELLGGENPHIVVSVVLVSEEGRNMVGRW